MTAWMRVRTSLLAMPALGGAVSLLAATPHGIGIYPDSVMYIMMARSLLRGGGWTMGGTPVELFPPLYPALLALAGVFGSDPIAGARWMQAVVWAANIFWLGLITYEITRKSIVPALLASVLALGAVDLLAYHAIALSDGAFLFFFIPSLLALHRYLNGGKVRFLVVSAVLTALAAITRQAGLAAIAGGAIAILLLQRGALRERIRRAAMFGAIGFLPSAIWIVRNLQFDNPLGRGLDVHGFLGIPAIKNLIHTCSAWFFQWKVGDAWWMTAVPVVLVVLSVFWIRSGAERSGRARENCYPLLLIYMVVYVALLILTAALFQADLFWDSARLMMPLHVLLIILVVSSGYEWLKSKRRRVLRAAGYLVSAAAAVLVLITGMQYVGEMSEDGQGYASKSYRDSPLIKRTKSIQSGIAVYTNVRLPIVLYADRMVLLTPLKVNNSTQRENEQYDTEMKSMAAGIRDSSAVLVYFNRGAGWFVQPTLDDIRRYVPLRLIAREKDGGVYEAGTGSKKNQF